MSSSVTLSAATRQNLLSLQDTASLLSTTQNRLSTGKKVNSALDNPTNFFTSQSLSNRSSDLANTLDGMSNSIQTIQAANQGITSMQKLLDSAKSTLNQALAAKTSPNGAGTPATTAKVFANNAIAATTDFSDTNEASFEVTVGTGGTAAPILLNKDTLKSAAKDLTKVTQTEILSAINNQLNANDDTAGLVSAKLDTNGRLSFESSAVGTTASINVKVVAASGSNALVDIGFGTTADDEFAGAGADLVPSGASANETRAKLTDQFNELLSQITKQSQDASFNGVNLLNRGALSEADHKLRVIFNEDGSSDINIQGVDFTKTGLGFAAGDADLTRDTNINDLLKTVDAASGKLRAQSSTFGSNLSVVQTRQDFAKNLINILDTGSANLTSADLNEEAANSQALSTRNSLAISALSLANQSQQGILQLLR